MKKSVRNKIVESINELLRKTWTDDDIKKGKKIRFLPKYNGQLNQIVPLYEGKGWKITKNVVVTSTEREIYLSFKNPYW